MDFSGSEAVAVLGRASVRGGFEWIRGVDKKVQPKSAKVSAQSQSWVNALLW